MYTSGIACYRCAHFLGPRNGWGLRCKAFPDRIPDEIVYEGRDHTVPIEGDHGIQFEPAPEDANDGNRDWRGERG